MFKIDKSRGSKVLEDVLGKDFAGIISSDYWGAYRKYARLFDVRVLEISPTPQMRFIHGLTFNTKILT
ncbi:MAG: transposase [Planctomycetes bacterium]|nr:transposase [Planctomycetota bacterium]